MIIVERRVAPIAYVSANIRLSPATMHEKGVQENLDTFSLYIYKYLVTMILPTITYWSTELCRHGLELLQEGKHHEGTDQAEADEDGPVVNQRNLVPKL